MATDKFNKNFMDLEKFKLSELDFKNISYSNLNIYIKNIYKRCNNIIITQSTPYNVSLIYKFFIDLTFFKNQIIKIINNIPNEIKKRVYDLNNIYIKELEEIYNENYILETIVYKILYIYNNKPKNIDNALLLKNINQNDNPESIIKYLIDILLELNKLHIGCYNKLSEDDKEKYIPGFYNENKETYYDINLFKQLDIDYIEKPQHIVQSVPINNLHSLHSLIPPRQNFNSI